MADAKTRDLLNHLPNPTPGNCKVMPDGTKVCHQRHKMPNAPNAVTVHTYQPGAPGRHFDVFTPTPAAAPGATCQSGTDPDPPAAWAPSSSYIGPVADASSGSGSCGSCEHNRLY